MYISIHPTVIMSSSQSICLLHGSAGMSGQTVYIFMPLALYQLCVYAADGGTIVVCRGNMLCRKVK